MSDHVKYICTKKTVVRDDQTPYIPHVHARLLGGGHGYVIRPGEILDGDAEVIQKHPRNFAPLGGGEYDPLSGKVTPRPSFGWRKE